MSEPDKDYLLRLRPTTMPGPVVGRLRAALKVLLRRFGLRCVEMREVPQEQGHVEQKRD